ncbi:putative F-box associated interaction domain-containing protein [Medicago truncatula]|uniref:Putative F-box associated interaction domain-containing protein n=1 Tax=Medicago truncatula TaxID=3880 RepID=A0A396JXT7_MEDTR|nr:putative F-box associated interaction domain-containing protein [Medicago truncatula]
MQWDAVSVSSRAILCQFVESFYQFEIKRSPTIVSSERKVMRFRGFGYDQLNDKYKVVVGVSSLNDYANTVTRIYTFGENSWKTLHNFPYYPHTSSYVSYTYGKSVTGTLNWIVNKDGVYFNKVILSFHLDLVKETYREVLLPQHDGYNECYHGLFVLSNCLCVCFDNFNESRKSVWMMKECGVFESWTKFMIIPHEKLHPSYGLQPFVEPLFISENGVVILLTKSTYYTVTSQFILYNINNDAVDYSSTFGKVDLHIYHESLI